MKTFLKHHSLIIGLVLMFLYTWSIDLSNSGVLPFKIPFPIYITLGWGFIFASLLMTWLTLGKAEMVKLFKRFFICRVGRRRSHQNRNHKGGYFRPGCNTFWVSKWAIYCPQ